MPNRTIVRVEEGTQVSNDVYEKIKEIMGTPELIKEEYPIAPDLEKSYTDRIQILRESLQFIIDNFPRKRGALSDNDFNRYLGWIDRFLPLEKQQTLEYYQQRLFDYNVMVLGLLINNWDLPHKKNKETPTTQAIEWLNRAEQFVLLQKGRDNLATLSEISFTNAENKQEKKLVLQVDKILNPCTADALKELKTIQNKEKKSSIPNQVPDWFNELTVFQKMFLYHFESKSQGKTDIVSFAQMLLYHFKEMSRKPEFAQIVIDIHSGKKPKNYAQYNEYERFLIDYLIDEKYINRDCTLEASIISNLEELKQKLSDMDESYFEGNESPRRAISRLPVWYLLLQPFEQKMLKAALDKIDLDKPIAVSSRLRILPVLANATGHVMYVVEYDGRIIFQTDVRLRASHLASRDILDLPGLINTLYTERNINSILALSEGKDLLIQTLISPIGTEGVAADIAKMFIPDVKLDRELRKQIAKIKEKQEGRSEKLFFTNHPQNMAALVYRTESNDPECNAFLNHAKSHLAKLEGLLISDQTGELEKTKKYIEDLSVLINEYDLVLHHLKQSSSKIIQAVKSVIVDPVIDPLIDYQYQRELQLSSLESLLIHYIEGSSFGCCVSAKDRKGLEFLHTNAMFIHRLFSGRWPSWNDEGSARQSFDNLFADLYTTWHAQEIAGQNAKGANGIKTPDGYLRKSTIDAINSRTKSKLESKTGRKTGPVDIAKIDEYIASNNEIKDIKGKLIGSKTTVKMKKVDCQKESAFMPALLKMNAASMATLASLFKSIATNWSEHKMGIKYLRTAAFPGGIRQMKGQLHKNDAEIVNDFLKIIADHIDKNTGKRKPETTHFYGLIKRVSEILTGSRNEDKGKDIETLLQEPIAGLESLSNKLIARKREAGAEPFIPKSVSAPSLS
ncbi:hypothetical protein ACFORL_03975 [Legionella dresdenensis]|uniref:Oxidoreductase n=1 Tax=Legionella dresdenensis TaxID=450200 RepID=A0ABV8CDQ3_9GAMM